MAKYISSNTKYHEKSGIQEYTIYARVLNIINVYSVFCNGIVYR